MNRRDSLQALGAFLVGPGLMRPFDPYFDLPDAKMKGTPIGPPPPHRKDLLPPRNPLQKARAYLCIFDDPCSLLLNYKSALLGPDGQSWAGPKILDCQRDAESGTAHFTLQPLVAKGPITVSGIRLFHPSGYWRADSSWSTGPQTLDHGDTLNVNLDFTINIPETQYHQLAKI